MLTLPSALLPRPAWAEGAEILRQFMLGPAGSGAPPHFHGPAVNTLVHGVKDWVLYPPAHAFFSTSPVRDWAGEFDMSNLPSHSKTSSQSGSPKSAIPARLRCRQHAGDVVVVPNAWGHAVLNRRFVIAAAYEFRL